MVASDTWHGVGPEHDTTVVVYRVEIVLVLAGLEFAGHHGSP